MVVNNNPNIVLVVGDFVIDEHWFLVRQFSDISSHTGFVHFRLLNDIDDILIDLCGAGLVSQILYELRDKHKQNYGLVASGLWNKGDEDVIAHLLHSRNTKCSASKVTFRLTTDICDKKPGIKLVTLNKDHPTLRIIRSYRGEKNTLEQINRIDWQSKSTPPAFESNQDELPAPWDTAAIVLDDLKKGCISEPLIEKLKERYPDAYWYIKSKDVAPKWLRLLRNKLRLFVIGPEVAVLRNPWDRWVVNGKATLQGMEIVSNVSASNTVLLSDRREIVARVLDTRQCFAIQSGTVPPPLKQLHWADSLFTALAFRLINKGSNSLDKQDFVFSMGVAEQYCGTPTLRRWSSKKPEPTQYPVIVPSNWRNDKLAWKQANKSLGLVKGSDDKLSLEVWRGSTQIPGYVACIDGKRAIIDEIGHQLRTFAGAGQNNQKSATILLSADPGSGKTFLARSLATSFNFEFLDYDVSQMVHREEVLDVFDMVATRLNNSKKSVLVFIDEINGLVEGNTIYNMFLSPLESGVYIRRGKVFSLRPCVWIFAGTKLDEKNEPHSEKLSDFRSRMTLIKNIDFESLSKGAKGQKAKERLYEQARLEQVYIGALMLRRAFPDVEFASERVLYEFYSEDPRSSPARRILNRALTLRNDFGRVSCKDAGMLEKRKKDHDVKKTNQNFVQLIFDKHQS